MPIVPAKPLAGSLLPWFLLFAACGAAPVKLSEFSPREVVTLERWNVQSEGRLLGEVVHLEIRDPSGPVRFYRVLDPAGRWVGHASDILRFSRRVPFEEQEEDLGVFSLQHGAALLLEASAPVVLDAVPVDAVWRKSGR